MTDLFMSKKEQLYDWMCMQRFIRTSDVVKWGVKNYCNDAPRLARKLCENEKIRRLERWEMARYGFGKTKEKIYEVC